jgi:hypothetical protein
LFFPGRIIALLLFLLLHLLLLDDKDLLCPLFTGISTRFVIRVTATATEISPHE